MQNKKILIGIIGKPHSLNGELRVNSYCSPKEQLAKYSPLIDESNNQFFVTKFKNNKNILICKFKNINNRTEAEKLNHTKLFILRSQLLEDLNEEEFYIEDLIGLNIKNNNENIGKITQIHNFGAGDILEIKFNNNKTELISFTKENFPEINFENNFLIINIKKI